MKFNFKKKWLILGLVLSFGVLAKVTGLDRYVTQFGIIQLSQNKIYDSTGTKRLEIGSTNALTGGLTVSSDLTVSGTTYMTISVDAAPRTNITPQAIGQLIYNTGDGELCFSTGTVATSWVRVSTPTVACAS